MSKRGEIKAWKKPGEFETIRQIRGANRAAGHHFFSRGAMSFFGTKIERGVHAGRYFITSEQDPSGLAWDGERRWTIREIDESGSIFTKGEFGRHRSRASALMAIEELLKEEDAEDPREYAISERVWYSISATSAEEAIVLHYEGETRLQEQNDAELEIFGRGGRISPDWELIGDMITGKEEG